MSVRSGCVAGLAAMLLSACAMRGPGAPMVPSVASAPAPAPTRDAASLRAAEALVDAFYSFDRARLDAALVDAPASRPTLLYYQGWAKGGNYRVVERRPCVVADAGGVTCAITVEDDLIRALRDPRHVTDVFHIDVKDGRVVSVRNSSNDPPEFEQALAWVRATQDAAFRQACAGFFAGGPTPGDCVRLVVRGFAEWKARAGHEG